MTDSKKRFALSRQIVMGASSGLSLELRKTKLGAVAFLSGVLAVEELTGESVVLLTHFGRIHFCGEGLTVSVFAERHAEVLGKITEVGFSYGKA